ncbi:structural protein [Cellulophaga phage phi10:1]|uniref:Structural protein n=1 Tax=Cellulophaga phage phi10:1 TaxID=1327981 RepID=S0A0U4_9CAUD|nr:structural protein [Cellulophaga phage phi10:1]AGO48430.1 structural protein [Cellulophaga phage phi10:1]
MPKLTDRTELVGSSRSTDQIHVVRDGGSYRMQLSAFLNNASGFFRVSNGTSELFVFRKVKTLTPSVTLQTGDFCILINTTENIMIVGMAVATTTGTIDNLRNTSNFLRFYEGTSLL